MRNGEMLKFTGSKAELPYIHPGTLTKNSIPHISYLMANNLSIISTKNTAELPSQLSAPIIALTRSLIQIKNRSGPGSNTLPEAR